MWVTNSKDEFLLAKRAKSKTYDPGKWKTAVAGTVEKGETYRQNILKETAEEIGVKGIRLKKGPKFRKSTNHEYFVQWFFVKIDKPAKEFKIQKSEVEEIKWFSKSGLLKKIRQKNSAFSPSLLEYTEIFGNNQ